MIAILTGVRWNLNVILIRWNYLFLKIFPWFLHTFLKILDSKPPIPLSTEVPTGSSQHFQLNFTITNLPYSQDIAQPGTTQYQQNKRSIEHAVRTQLCVHFAPRQRLTYGHWVVRGGLSITVPEIDLHSHLQIKKQAQQAQKHKCLMSSFIRGRQI
jgi:hypothetical protein